MEFTQKQNQLHEEQSAGAQLTEEKQVEQDKNNETAQGEQSAKDIDAPLRVLPAPDPVDDEEQENRHEWGDVVHGELEDRVEDARESGRRGIGDVPDARTEIVHEDRGEKIASDQDSQGETWSEGRFRHRPHHHAPGAPPAIAKPRLLPCAGGWEMIPHA